MTRGRTERANPEQAKQMLARPPSQEWVDYIAAQAEYKLALAKLSKAKFAVPWEEYDVRSRRVRRP
jgi:hypothetical protein